MTRRTDSKPEVRLTVNGVSFWLSTIVPQGWGGLSHGTRLNGSYAMGWTIPNAQTWRHPALVYGALVEIYLGPICVWSGTLDEPDWDEGVFVAIGACREAETTPGLDESEDASTAPDTVIDAAIADGGLTWTRLDDFGTDEMGDRNGGLVTLRSILDAWAEKNNSRWLVNEQRQAVIAPVDEDDPKWYVVPGSGVLGSAAEDRVDRLYGRYIDIVTGQRETAKYPTTGTAIVKRTADLTDRPAMTEADAQAILEGRWSGLKGRSGWTNGLTLARGQVTTKGGVVADLALIKAGETVRLLGVADPRGIAHNLDVVIGETDYDWTDDELQINPVGLAARDAEGVLETVGNLAVDAMAAATADRTGDTDWNDLTVDPNPAFANVTAEYRVRDGDVTIRVLGTLNTGSGTTYTPVPAGSIPAGIRPATTANGGAVVGGRVGVIGVLATGAVVLLQDSGVTANGAVSATYTYPIG